MIGWFLAPYKVRTSAGELERYCAMDDFTTLIVADGLYQGEPWSEAECLGSYAVVKVSATAATMATINAAPGMTRIPVARLDDPLSTLTAGQKSTVVSTVTSLGYSVQELQSVLPNDLGTYTLRDVLQFVCRRRLTPRWDVPTQAIILNGAVQPVKSLSDVDAAVR